MVNENTESRYKNLQTIVPLHKPLHKTDHKWKMKSRSSIVKQAPYMQETVYTKIH